MRLGLAIVLGMVFSVSAQGSVFAFLRPNPVVIVIQGIDSDAVRLFDSLDVLAIEQSDGSLEKAIKAPSGQISISCRYSELTKSASCTVKIKRETNLRVSEEDERLYLQSYVAEDTEYLFKRLVKNSEGKVPMFVSERQDFAYSSSRDHFILSYQSVAP